MSEMVERVARAMAQNIGDPDALCSQDMLQYATDVRYGVVGLHFKAPDHAYRPLWQLMVPAAKAAIEAMRGPSRQMLQSGIDASYHHEDFDSCEAIWTAMIDVSLGKK